MYNVMRRLDNQPSELIGTFETYSEAKSMLTCAVIKHRNIFGRNSILSRCSNSSSRYPYRIEITDDNLTDCYYVATCEQ